MTRKKDDNIASNIYWCWEGEVMHLAFDMLTCCQGNQRWWQGVAGIGHSAPDTLNERKCPIGSSFGG